MSLLYEHNKDEKLGLNSCLKLFLITIMIRLLVDQGLAHVDVELKFQCTGRV